MAWIPITDVSKWQGDINFATMRAAGVKGVILRLSNGASIDDRFAGYWRDATAVFGRNVCVYAFVNPKAAGAQAAARVVVDQLARTAGRTDVGVMLDIESYAGQPPYPGEPITGAAFATYIRQMRAELERFGCRVFAYSNAAYFNTAVRDPQLAREFDWIVPRYPVHTSLGYALRPVPENPDLWDEWAFARASDGPRSPFGVPWAGWQFSADYNRQGARYGVSSSALDLNIVDADAWARWTGTREGFETMKEAQVRLTPDPVAVKGGVEYTFQTGWSGSRAIVNVEVVAPTDNGWVKVWTAGPEPVPSRIPYRVGDPAAGGDLLTGLAFGTFKLKCKTDCKVSVDLAWVEDDATQVAGVVPGFV